MVAAGTALLAAAALGATSFAGPATVVGGGAALAAGAGGMMVAEEMCLGKMSKLDEVQPYASIIYFQFSACFQNCRSYVLQSQEWAVLCSDLCQAKVQMPSIMLNGRRYIDTKKTIKLKSIIKM